MGNIVTDQRGEPQRSRSRHRGDRRGTYAGLAVSTLAHLLLVVLYPFFSGRHPVGPPAPYQPPARESEGMRVVRIVEVPSPDVGDPGEPVEMEEVEEVELDAEAPDFDEEFRVGFPDRPRYPSALERLRLSPGDPRLWSPVDPELAALSADRILALDIAIALEAGIDSAAAEAERARRALDWTRTDEDGRRWGVSPGKIHLGDLTIPLPFGFGPPPDYTGERAEWAYRMADIDRAAATLAIRRHWQDRRAAMKKRREELRALKDKKEKEDVGLPVVRQDTIPGRPGRR